MGRYVKFCRLFLTPILKTHFPSTTALFLLHIFIFLLFLNISNISLTIELVLYYIIHIIPPTQHTYFINTIYPSYILTICHSSTPYYIILEYFSNSNKPIYTNVLNLLVLFYNTDAIIFLYIQNSTL